MVLEGGFVAIILAFCVKLLIFPVLAEEEVKTTGQAMIDLQIEVMNNETRAFGELTPSDSRPIVPYGKMSISAYNSVAWQTDSTPCIGAAGTNICQSFEAGQAVCAANFVPLGTVLSVEGLGRCTVLDRMNARYTRRVDWFMGYDVPAAKQFGVRTRSVVAFYD